MEKTLMVFQEPDGMWKVKSLLSDYHWKDCYPSVTDAIESLVFRGIHKDTILVETRLS